MQILGVPCFWLACCLANHYPRCTGALSYRFNPPLHSSFRWIGANEYRRVIALAAVAHIVIPMLDAVTDAMFYLWETCPYCVVESSPWVYFGDDDFTIGPCADHDLTTICDPERVHHLRGIPMVIESGNLRRVRLEYHRNPAQRRAVAQNTEARK